MNSLAVGVLALVFLCLGYKFYGRLMEKVWGVDPARPTPAMETPDKVDYMPAKHWTVLFGHHFASIAGAGPILGPVIAAMVWGWFPALIWIVLGSIFIGGVHDISSLMISIRHKGKSIADVAQGVLSFRSKMVFAAFVFLSLILVMAVFSAVTAKTLVNEPRLVIPTFGLILVAILVGFMIYRWMWNLVIATTLGIILLLGLIILGNYFPISLKVANPLSLWILILLIYAYMASVLPVNILLQPRDYLSTFILFFGIFFGYLGLIITHPKMHTPAFIRWTGNLGQLWPMLCVIIACGAISGFHSLIASGTTSKQLANEKDAKKIGYGGMILEGIVAVLALLSVTAGLYWRGEGLVYPQLMASGDWIGTFSLGFGQIAWPIFGALGASIAALMLNAFVITTLDTATRINRYIAKELFGEGLRIKIFRNRYFSTAIVVALTLWLALGDWQAIWPIFGASNQLVAALVLTIVSIYMMSSKRLSRYTLFPAIFMLATAIGALLLKIKEYLKGNDNLLLFIAAVLLLLAIFILYEAIMHLRKKDG